MASRTPVTPDVVIDVLPRSYEAALACDNERWADHSDGPTRWNDAPVWTLTKGTTERAWWSMRAHEGDRLLEEEARRETSQLVATLITGRSFRTEGALVEAASELLSQQLQRQLSDVEYLRVVDIGRELWAIGRRSRVLVFSITDRGRKALAECWDCFEPAAPNDTLCASCRSKHVAPPPRVA